MKNEVNPASHVFVQKSIMIQGAGVSRVSRIAAIGRPLRFSSSSSSAEGNTPDLSKQRLLDIDDIDGVLFADFLGKKWRWNDVEVWKVLWKKNSEVS